MKRLRANSNNTVFYKIAILFSAGMLIIIGALSYIRQNEVSRAQEQLLRSRERQVELAKLHNIVKEAESAQRAYIITRNTLYLNASSKSRALAAPCFTHLKSLSNGNTNRNKDLDRLWNLITARFKILDKSLAIHTGNYAAASSQSQHKEGFEAMEHIDLLANTIHRNENAALRKYEMLHVSKSSTLPYITGFLILFSMLLLIISFYKIHKDSLRFRKINQDLVLTNNSFRIAEEMSQMGHWKRDLVDFTITPSDNMYRLLGLVPGAVPYNEQTLLNFVHPEDADILTHAFANLKNLQEPPNINYRIIRPDGAIRHFRSSSKRVEVDGVPVLLGTTLDITTDVQNRQHIEQKNKELELMVKELASFNHIASHDLQEPLRKIQVFISRIVDDENETLTDSGKMYFSRVTAAANRMEMLINDLLLYSESGRDTEALGTHSLNLVLNEALHELAADIDAAKATVTFDSLPSLPIVPFQIRQLFINLISNALKYSKPGVAPIIAITCAEAAFKDIAGSNRQGYEFTVTDNGIGFLQEYAEKIFVLFTRLHGKDKYSGTGIGLAICKKIVENHNGTIIAQSAPGQGSSFRFYLPK